MLGNALNAIIIASSFILTFIQFSETGENQRREISKQKLQNAKDKLSEEERVSDSLKDEYDNLVGQPRMEYKTVRAMLFFALVLAFLFHIAIIIFPAPLLPAWLVVFISIFIVILIILMLQSIRSRKNTNKYIEACSQLEKTYTSTYSVAKKLKAGANTP